MSGKTQLMDDDLEIPDILKRYPPAPGEKPITTNVRDDDSPKFVTPASWNKTKDVTPVANNAVAEVEAKIEPIKEIKKIEVVEKTACNDIALNKEFILKILLPVRDGATLVKDIGAPVYHIKKMIDHGYLTVKSVKITPGRGRPSSVHSLTAKGEKYCEDNS